MLQDKESDKEDVSNTSGEWDDIEAEKPEHQRGFRSFMLEYQYPVMFSSLALGFTLVSTSRFLAGHWILSRLILLLGIIVFAPAGIVTMAHLRETWITRYFYWEWSNRLWTTRRSSRTEKIELIVLSVLWSVILLFVVYAVFQR